MLQWQEAEAKLARMVKGKVVTNLNLQYKDIDVISDNFSYSVKQQNNVVKYDSILFEIKLVDTSTNQSIEGSFLKCEADRYAINFDNYWMLFDTAKLREFVLDNNSNIRTTQGWLEDKNRQEGRKYNRGVNISLKPSQLYTSDAFITGSKNLKEILQ